MENLKINKKYLGKLQSRKRKIKPEFIIIHHTCTGSTSTTRSVLKTRGLSTHFEIATDGEVFQYIGLDRAAYHAGKQNERSIGIDLTHLQDADFSKEQMKALKLLVGKICEHYEIIERLAPDKRLEPSTEKFGVYRHRNFSNTRCPDNAPLEEIFEN